MPAASRPRTIEEFLACDPAHPSPARVIAHRGFSGAAPENTLSAFREALAAGADMIEFDVLLSSDGAVMVIHDETLDRTTNGAGPVASLPFTELRKLDAGAWFGAEFAGEMIPTLAEVLDFAKGRILLNIEIKGEAVTANLQTGIEARVLDLVTSRGMIDEVIVSSFHPLALEHCRALSKEVALAALYDRECHKGLSPREITGPIAARGFNLAADEITQEIVAQCRAEGLFLSVYTVNTAEEMRRIISLGANALFTNEPEIMRGVVG